MKFHVLKCWMFSFEDRRFFCSLDFLYGGLGIVVFDQNFFFSAVNFFQFFVIKILDPDRYSAKNAGSRSVSNEYGCETLPYCLI
jgi:hypothetical protein